MKLIRARCSMFTLREIFMFDIIPVTYNDLGTKILGFFPKTATFRTTNQIMVFGDFFRARPIIYIYLTSGNWCFINSAVILEKYGEQFFSKGFSTDYGKYRSQLTTKKSPKKNLWSFLHKPCAKLRTRKQTLK